MADALKNLKHQRGEMVFAISKAYSEDEDARWYCEGYPSTDDPDLIKDIMDEDCLHGLAKDYLNNSTVFIDHKTDNAIGKVVETKVEAGKLWAKILISKTAADVWQRIKEGVLNKFSIQFIPLEVKEEQDGKGNLFRRILRAIGLEISVVGLPMNPAARMLDWYVAKGFEAPAEDEAVEFSVNLPFFAPANLPSGDRAFAASLAVPASLLDGELAAKFAASLVNTPVVADAAVAGHVTGAAYRHGAVILQGVAKVGEEYAALTLHGLVHKDAGRVVGVALNLAELSTEAEAKGFEEVKMDNTPEIKVDAPAEEKGVAAQDTAAPVMPAGHSESQFEKHEQFDERGQLVQLAKSFGEAVAKSALDDGVKGALADLLKQVEAILAPPAEPKAAEVAEAHRKALEDKQAEILARFEAVAKQNTEVFEALLKTQAEKSKELEARADALAAKVKEFEAITIGPAGATVTKNVPEEDPLAVWREGNLIRFPG